jgi:DHA2 family methylenomycin A resistance protein-like MFS transporter
VRPTWVLVAVCSSILFIGLNTTAMNTAIGVIAEDFSLSTAGVAWAINGYMLAAAALVAPGGQFGDVFGRRKMFAIGLALFAAGSITVAISPNEVVLIIGRVLQGGGSAFLLPAQLSIIRVVFPPERQGFAVGIWAAVASLTFAIGPVYGGLFADTIGWRWMFWADLVFIAITVALSLKFLRPIREQTMGGKPDYIGAVLLGAAILAAVLALQQGPVWGWTSPAVIGAAIAVPVLLATFVFVELRVAGPIVHLRLFRTLPYTGGVVTTFAQGFGLMGFLYLVANYTESFAIYDFSALEAGLVLFPGGVVMFVGALFGGRWADHAGYRIPNTVAMSLIAVGAGLYLVIDKSSPIALIAGIGCIGGIGIGVGFSTTSASGMSAVPPSVGGEAAGMINASRYIGVVFVIALATSLGTFVSVNHLNDGLASAGVAESEEVSLDNAMRQSSDDLKKAIDDTTSPQQLEVLTAVEDSMVAGFKAAQLLVALVAALAAIASWTLFKSEGRSTAKDRTSKDRANTH